jgi:hypothetical protein
MTFLDLKQGKELNQVLKLFLALLFYRLKAL